MKVSMAQGVRPHAEGGREIESRLKQIDKQIAQLEKDQSLRQEVKSSRLKMLKAEKKTLEQRMKKAGQRDAQPSAPLEKAAEFIKGETTVEGIYRLDKENQKLLFNRPAEGKA